MKSETRIWKRTLTGLAVLGALIGTPEAAAAQGCSNATLTGTYGIQMEGTRPVAGGGTEIVVGVVIRTYNGMGGFTQVDNIKGSSTGITPDRPGSGTYQVNADCSGTTQFEPAPGTTLTEKIVVVSGGAEVYSIVTSPAAVMVAAVQKKTGVSAPQVPPPSVTPCQGPDPFASIPGLVGECVDGGWRPRQVGGADNN